MSITVNNPAEAFAIVATLVRAADKIGSIEEKKYIFENAKSLDIFSGYDDEKFTELLTSVNQKVFTSESTDDLSLSDEKVAELCESIKEVLSDDEISKAYTMACELACSDGLLEVEKNLLVQIQQNLGIEKEQADEILSKANRG